MYKLIQFYNPHNIDELYVADKENHPESPQYIAVSPVANIEIKNLLKYVHQKFVISIETVKKLFSKK